MNQEESSKKIWIIGGIVIILLIGGIILFFALTRTKSASSRATGTGSFFGFLGGDTPRPVNTGINSGSSTADGAASSATPGEPLFRQLSTVQVAGATTVVRGGKTFVRYIARENGYIYEVDPVSGTSKQLTNTTVPRIYEAYWGNGGNTVIIRFLSKDAATKRDIIKTEIGDLVLPIASSTAELGSLQGLKDRLPDDITEISVSPNGVYLFYLLPVEDGVSGTLVTLASRSPKEVLRNSFSEWLPDMLNDGNVILTTKPSANVPGFSYLYNTTSHTLSRILREKAAVTVLAEPTGKRVLYSENISGNTILSMYDAKGFTDGDGTSHTVTLQLATLPEKCTWSQNAVRVFCGAFASTPHNQIPDDWYQGTMFFKDTFWTIDTDTSELVFLADPVKEIGKSFDVLSSFSGGDENHFFFIDKNDFTLWSMRLMKDLYMSGTDQALPGASTAPVLTPDELKDAAGSNPPTAPTSKKPAVKTK